MSFEQNSLTYETFQIVSESEIRLIEGLCMKWTEHELTNAIQVDFMFNIFKIEPRPMINK